MTVTELIPIDRKRSKVFIEGEYAFFLYNQELNKYGIEEGTVLDEAVYCEIDEQVIPKRVKARALYILKASQKTERQLLDKLIEGGYSLRYAAIGVEYAKSFGYIDDLRYTQFFVENSCRGRSRRDIEQRLMRRGIDKEIIRQVLEESLPENEDEAIWAALRKKAVNADNVGELDWEHKNKLYAYLRRKGFSAHGIGRILQCDRYGE